MTTLAADTPRTYQVGEIEEYPVTAGDIIYEGAAVGEDGFGFSRPLSAGDTFQGFAESQADNTLGNKNVRVKTKGRILLGVTGVTDATVNDRPAVYATDDNTFTLTAAGNSLIGYVSRYVSSGMAIVEFDSGLCKAALQA